MDEEKREIVPEEKKTPRVKKRSVGRKIVDSVISEDIPSVGEYIVFELLIPAIKDTVLDMVNKALEMTFYGGSGNRSRRSSRPGGSHTDYSGYSKARKDDYRRNFGLEDLVYFESRGDAEEILDLMMEIADTSPFHQVSVAEYYELVGKTPRDYTARDWGWKENHLRKADCGRVRGGEWKLNLPRPIELD